jgi:DNA-binding NtrC family response regulator
MAAIWIVSEEPGSPETLAFHLRALGEVWTGAPGLPDWSDAPSPDLVVLVASDEPGASLAALERLLEFVRGIAHPRRPVPPILFVAPEGGRPSAELARSLIDDRPVEACGRPLDPDEVVEIADRLLDRPLRPPSLRERARRSWVAARVERFYTSLDLRSLQQAIDPRNAPRPVLLLGEAGSGRGLLARYIHNLAEPPRERLIVLELASLAPDEVEERIWGVTQGRRVTVYLAGMDRAPREVQEEIAHVLAESGLVGVGAMRWIASAQRFARLVPSLRLLGWLRVELPPLRQRDDLPALVQRLADDWAERAGRRVSISEAAAQVLRSYGWPRNLRELEAVLEASLSACPGDVLEAEGVRIGARPETAVRAAGEPVEEAPREVPTPSAPPEPLRAPEAEELAAPPEEAAGAELGERPRTPPEPLEEGPPTELAEPAPIPVEPAEEAAPAEPGELPPARAKSEEEAAALGEPPPTPAEPVEEAAAAEPGELPSTPAEPVEEAPLAELAELPPIPAELEEGPPTELGELPPIRPEPLEEGVPAELAELPPIAAEPLEEGAPAELAELPPIAAEPLEEGAPVEPVMPLEEEGPEGAELLEGELEAPLPPATAAGEMTVADVASPLAQEVRQPLLAIRTLANLLDELPEDAALRDKLASLVEGDLTRVEEAMQRLERFAAFGPSVRRGVDLAALVSAQLERRRAQMNAQGLVILEELDREAPAIMADEEQLEFAVGALLDRALRMVPEGGDLYVGSFHHPPSAAEPAHQRLLIRFHSPEDVLVRPAGATGPPMPLEVLLAQALIERMDGTFAVDTSGTQDNVILIDLPV